MTFPRFYPIVPDAGWVARLAPLGIRVIQLRMKGIPPAAIEPAIRAALAACEPHGCDLVVNDYSREAIMCGAPWVHLGQEDLAEADVAAIKGSGLKLGISTHDHRELETALAAKPDYIALGPIYETTLKKMRFAPQGLDRIGEWRSRIPVPLVAIGGITLERAPGVYAAGADSIAVVSDVIGAPDPEARVKAWLQM
jgi:thiamine-phosphate diphosphorylase